MPIGEKGLAIGRNATDPARWKRYRGGTSGEIWVDAEGSGTFSKLPLPNGNPTWPMPVADRIYFLADHEGIGNIYSCAFDGSDVRRHTHEPNTTHDFRRPTASASCIRPAVKSRVWTPRPTKCAAFRFRNALDGAANHAPLREASESLEHFAPHPDGTRLAFVSRGQAFAMPLFDGAVTHHGPGSKARTRLTEWLHDGKRFATVTDINGYEQIAIYDSGSTGAPKLITTGDIGRVTDLKCSPTSDVIAFANHRHELCFVDVEDGKVRVSTPRHRVAF